MSVLVYIPIKDGKATKAGLEAASYAVAIDSNAVAVTSGEISGDAGLGVVGISKVLSYSSSLTDNSQIAKLVDAAANDAGATTIVFSANLEGGATAPRVAIRQGAGYVAGATELPEGGSFTRNVFSGKAKANIEVSSGKTVVSVTPNAFGVVENGGGEASVEGFDAEVGSSKVSFGEFTPSSADGSIPLPEADKVVSAGRGLKAPENWGIIEDLAHALGAATACSRPVGDMGWRPHHEHVGQTGVTVRPDLYIACGISGAIQHLAGVNQSKVIVVINTDPEAPFFKAADYGIVGDVFEVLPKLTEAIKQLS